MANIIFKVITVYINSGLTDEALGKKMTKAISGKRKQMSRTKAGELSKTCMHTISNKVSRGIK